jgi:hypothetical protein
LNSTHRLLRRTVHLLSSDRSKQERKPRAAWANETITAAAVASTAAAAAASQ